MQKELHIRGHIQDMTQGSPMKMILWFAVPLFIGNIFQQVYSIIDTMVAGHYLGSSAVAAIGATSSIYSLIIGFLSGLNSGYGIVIARAFGAHKEKELHQSIAAMLVLNLGVSVLFTVVCLAAIRPLMDSLNVPADVFEQAYQYIAVIFGGILVTSLYNMCAALLRAVGDSRSPLYFLIIASIVNLALDLLFVAGFHTGVWGAALATVLAQIVSVVFCFGYLFLAYRGLLPQAQDFRLKQKILVEMLSTGFSMAIMLSIFNFGSVILQSAINHLGTAVITAHTAARRLIDMLMQPLTAIATASSTFTSQNWGAQQYGRIHTTVKKVVILEAAWGLFSTVVVYLFGSSMVTVLIGSAEDTVIQNAVMNLRLNFACFPSLGILLCLRTVMQSMESKIIPMVSSAIELAVKVLAVFTLIPAWGYFGASIAEPATWILCCIFLGAVYLLRDRILLLERGKRCEA